MTSKIMISVCPGCNLAVPSGPVCAVGCYCQRKPAAVDIMDEIHSKNTPYMYNDLEIQDTDSTACGFYCVTFILCLSKK